VGEVVAGAGVEVAAAEVVAVEAAADSDMLNRKRIKSNEKRREST